MAADPHKQDDFASARSRRSLLEGTVLGVVYGVVLRLSVGNSALTRWFDRHDVHGVSAVMTWSFVLLGPFVIGFLVVNRAERDARISMASWIFSPWLAIALMLVVTTLFRIEGFICIVMAAPIAFVLSSVGGCTAGILSRLRRKSGSRTAVSCLAILPFFLAHAEERLNSPTETRTVSSEIRIHASPGVVWSNIERVPAISPAELSQTWTHRIGFPRPVEATLSYEGVGGIRHATFEHGVLFIETVTDWEPQQKLAFTIRADNANIPPTTLDEHVTIGGQYFDVLDGEYRIEPLPGGDVILHLVSHQRLTTDFNGYAGLWTDAVMQSLQTSILGVIKHRCETV